MIRRRFLAALSSLGILRAAQRPVPGQVDPAKAKQAAPPPTGAPKGPSLPADYSDTPVIRATVNVVLVPTTVTNDKGETINGLRPEDFRLYDNDKLQQISRDIGFLPLSLVICIQRNVTVEGVIPTIKKMGYVLDDMLVGQDGEAAIIGFDHRVEVMQDFTNDPEKINAAVEKLKPGSTSSRMIDAVRQGIRMLRRQKDRRRVILLISETVDRASESNAREVATELQVYNVEVYTININRFLAAITQKPQYPRTSQIPPAAMGRPGGQPLDPTQMAQVTGAPGQAMDFVPLIVEMFRGVKAIFISNPAEVFTKFTGGREYGFIDQRQLEKAITDIGAEIRSQYLLSYTPNNKIEGGFHKIVVDVNRPDLKVRTRPGYWMAAVPD